MAVVNNFLTNPYRADEENSPLKTTEIQVSPNFFVRIVDILL
jgi:hypothetical protein